MGDRRAGGERARSLRCRACGTWMALRHARYGRDAHGVAVEGGIPTLRCPKCGESEVPAPVERMVQEAARAAAGSGRRSCRPEFGKRKFGLCKVRFVYDSTDWIAIPMLRQSADELDGYYAPVFFRGTALLRYMARDEYTTRQFRGGGSIHFSNGSDLMYGINRGGLVVCWLGELDGIPVSEQHHMRSENVLSDHDVASGLYSTSRLREDAGETDEQMLAGAMRRLSRAVRERRGHGLYVLREEEDEAIQGLARPVLWNEHAMPTIMGLVKVYIEALDVKWLREECAGVAGAVAPGPPCERCGAIAGPAPGGLQLLGAWLRQWLGEETDSVMRPFSVLQKWRNILAHRASRERGKSIYWCYGAMGVRVEQGPERLYDRVVRGMLDSYARMEEAIRIGPPGSPPGAGGRAGA